MDLSLVIITWNCKDMLERCLDSILKRVGGISYEIIVIDNNSQDGTTRMLKERFLQVHLLVNPENKGVAMARNQGITIAMGRYILILDADTEIISTNMADLIEYMDEHREAGLLGCSLFSFSDELLDSARTFPHPIHVILRRLKFLGIARESEILKRHHIAYRERKKPVVVDFVEGAFQLIRRDVVEKTGLLDEEMFYGNEDADYCARVTKAGYTVVYFPSFKVRHYHSAITRRNMFSRMSYYHLMSYVRFYRKHRDIIKRPI